MAAPVHGVDVDPATSITFPALILTVALGLMAGTVTTVSGFGGGMVLSLALAVWIGPAGALVVAAPALGVGHVHRTHLYREEIDGQVARRFLLGAVPGTVLGGVLAASVPEFFLAVALALGAGLAVVQAMGWIPTALGRRAVLPGAAGVGFLAASCGGGGVLLPPTLMSAGLRGRAFVATASVGALAIQLVRITTYGVAGMIAAWHLPLMVAVAVGVVGGNLLGRRFAARLDDRGALIATRSTLAVAVALGLYNAITV